MKKIVLLFSFILFILLASGQEYELVLKNISDGKEINIQNGKHVKIFHDYGKINKGRLTIINDSTIRIDTIYLSLTAINGIKINTYLINFIGFLAPTPGKMFMGVGSVFTFFGLLFYSVEGGPGMLLTGLSITSGGAILYVAGYFIGKYLENYKKEYYKEQWRFEIRKSAANTHP